MIGQAIENADKPGGGGGGCCGDDPVTPDSYIADKLPKMNESMLDILCAEPFNGANEFDVGTADSLGKNMVKFKGQTLASTILAFARRVKGVKLL